MRRPPALFRLARAIARRRLRGGHRLEEAIRRFGLLNRVVRYRISDGVSIDVPLWRPENAWDREDLLTYQSELVDDLVGAVAGMQAPATLLDCGADIGLISVLVAARCGDRLALIVAVEPNRTAYEVLEGNLARLPSPSRAVHAAASDRAGRGTLVSPEYDDSDHARFLVAEADGEVPVIRIDDLELPARASLVIKLDVEGGELQVLRGAERTLAGAAGFAVSFEAHPAVVERTGVDPVDIIAYLDGIKKCDVRVSEFPDLVITTGRPFFAQFDPPRRIGFSVLCRSR
jgi:FkbM family methyltransferase